MTTGRGQGRLKFYSSASKVLENITRLHQCKNAVKDSTNELTEHAQHLLNAVLTVRQNASRLETKRKYFQSIGVAATTVGSCTAAVLWAIAYMTMTDDGEADPAAPPAPSDSDSDDEVADYANINVTLVALAWFATGVGLAGTVLKMATAYFYSRQNKMHLKALESCTGGGGGDSGVGGAGNGFNGKAQALRIAESKLQSNVSEMVELLKSLDGVTQIQTAMSTPDPTGTGLRRRRPADAEADDGGANQESAPARAPALLTLLETADSASSAPDVISTLFEVSTDLGLDSLEIAQETYEAATASLSEIISFGLVEGAASGLSLALSTYEIYKLIGLWTQTESPTEIRLNEVIRSLEEKVTAYADIRRCAKVADTFSTQRSRSRSKVDLGSE